MEGRSPGFRAEGRSKLSGAAAGGGSARGLVIAKDILVGATLVSSVGAAIAGNAMSKQREGDAIPMNEEGEVDADAPPRARMLGRLTDAFGLLSICAGIGVVAVTAALAMRAGKSKTWTGVSRLLP